MSDSVVYTIVKSVVNNYLFAEFNEASEQLITDIKTKLSEQFNDVKVNLSYFAVNGDITVDVTADGVKEVVTVGRR